MRYIVFAVALCFVMPSAHAVAAVQTVKIKAKRNKVKHQKPPKGHNKSHSHNHIS
jgi:hypothetical protein